MLSQRGFETRQAQGHKVGRNRIIIDTKFGKGDKVRTRAKSKLFLLGLWIGDGEIFQLSMDNHLPLEQITADFDEKRRWFDSKVRYQWFNNMSLRDIYKILLDFYSVNELESFRAEYGDQILWQIYNDEMDYFYHC